MSINSIDFLLLLLLLPANLSRKQASSSRLRRPDSADIWAGFGCWRLVGRARSARSDCCCWHTASLCSLFGRRPDIVRRTNIASQSEAKRRIQLEQPCKGRARYKSLGARRPSTAGVGGLGRSFERPVRRCFGARPSCSTQPADCAPARAGIAMIPVLLSGR